MTESLTVPSINFDIYIAGDAATARQVCREYCFTVGLCVTVQPLDYIYTGGEEAGVRISLINYARFPSDYQTLRSKAFDLANLLMERLHQHSFSLVGPKESEWVSRRPPPAKQTQEALL